MSEWVNFFGTVSQNATDQDTHGDPPSLRRCCPSPHRHDSAVGRAHDHGQRKGPSRGREGLRDPGGFAHLHSQGRNCRGTAPVDYRSRQSDRRRSCCQPTLLSFPPVCASPPPSSNGQAPRHHPRRASHAVSHYNPCESLARLFDVDPLVAVSVPGHCWASLERIVACSELFSDILSAIWADCPFLLMVLLTGTLIVIPLRIIGWLVSLAETSEGE